MSRKLRKQDSTAALDEGQTEELKLTFDLFDEENNGHLTANDVKRALDKYGIKADAREMFKEADVTGSGKIGFPEFMSMMGRRMKAADSADDLTEAFRVFDPYGEGTIAQKELVEALTTQGDKLTKDEVQEMLSVCLVDGQVNYDMFVREMHSGK